VLGGVLVAVVVAKQVNFVLVAVSVALIGVGVGTAFLAGDSPTRFVERVCCALASGTIAVVVGSGAAQHQVLPPGRHPIITLLVAGGCAVLLLGLYFVELRSAILHRSMKWGGVLACLVAIASSAIAFLHVARPSPDGYVESLSRAAIVSPFAESSAAQETPALRMRLAQRNSECSLEVFVPTSLTPIVRGAPGAPLLSGLGNYHTPEYGPCVAPVVRRDASHDRWVLSFARAGFLAPTELMILDGPMLTLVQPTAGALRDTLGPSRPLLGIALLGALTSVVLIVLSWRTRGTSKGRALAFLIAAASAAPLLGAELGMLAFHIEG
jgi:hypothetical protein